MLICTPPPRPVGAKESTLRTAAGRSARNGAFLGGEDRELGLVTGMEIRRKQMTVFPRRREVTQGHREMRTAKGFAGVDPREQLRKQEVGGTGCPGQLYRVPLTPHTHSLVC